MSFEFKKVLWCCSVLVLCTGLLLGKSDEAAEDTETIPDAPKPTEGPIPKKKTANPEDNGEKKLSMVEEARLKALGIDPKYVDLKTIKRMEVFKMATPDKDADILGGTLKVRFQPVFKRSKPIINGNLWTTRFEEADDFGKYAAFSYGQSLKKWSRIPAGFSVGYTYDVDVIPKSVLARDWKFQTTETGEELLTIEDVMIEKENRHRVRHGLSLNFDYKLTADSFIYVKNYFQRMDQTDLNRSYEYKFAQGEFVAFDETSGSVTNGYIVRKLEDREYQNNYQSNIIGYLHESEIWEHEAQVQYKRYTWGTDAYWDSYFENRGLDLAFENADKDTIDLIAQNPDQANLTQNYLFGDLRLMEMEDSSSDAIFNADTRRKWLVPWGEFRIKTGIKYFTRDFKSTEDRWNYGSYEGGDFSIAMIEDEWSETGVGFSGYDLSGFPDAQGVQRYFRDNREQFVFDEANSRSQADPANYNVVETVNAAYLMLDNQWENLRVVAGARFESTSDEFEGKEVSLDEDGNYLGTADTFGSRQYQNVFPGVHSIYNVRPGLVFFSSWSRALTRPQFNYLAPFRKVIHRSQYISEGNPNLQPTIYDNMLVALDYNFSKEGFIKMEYLMRDYSDIVIRRREELEDGPFAGYRKDSWENVGSANLTRLDVRLFQGLGFISDSFSDFAVEVRYTHNDSSSDLREDENAPLVNTPEHRLQGTLKYAKDAVEVKAKVKYRDGFLSQIGEDQARDHFYEAQSTYDISFEYKVDEKLTGVIEVENLTNEGSQSYLGDPSRPMDYRSNGRYWKAGFRYRY